MRHAYLRGRVGSPLDGGGGLADGTSWLAALLALVVLIAVAWWAMRPTRRAKRAELRAPRKPDPASPQRGRKRRP